MSLNAGGRIAGWVAELTLGTGGTIPGGGAGFGGGGAGRGGQPRPAAREMPMAAPVKHKRTTAARRRMTLTICMSENANAERNTFWLGIVRLSRLRHAYARRRRRRLKRPTAANPASDRLVGSGTFSVRFTKPLPS